MGMGANGRGALLMVTAGYRTVQMRILRPRMCGVAVDGDVVAGGRVGQTATSGYRARASLLRARVAVLLLLLLLLTTGDTRLCCRAWGCVRDGSGPTRFASIPSACCGVVLPAVDAVTDVVFVVAVVSSVSSVFAVMGAPVVPSQFPLLLLAAERAGWRYDVLYVAAAAVSLPSHQKVRRVISTRRAKRANVRIKG
jgi:hypothetical protein